MTAPRFVILLHHHPAGDHWDLLLERGDVLAAWRLAADPFASAEPIPAERLPDHRKIYLEYEGPISGDRGSIERVDEGVYEELTSLPDIQRLLLKGQYLAGAYEVAAGAAGTVFRRHAGAMNNER